MVAGFLNYYLKGVVFPFSFVLLLKYRYISLVVRELLSKKMTLSFKIHFLFLHLWKWKCLKARCN